MVLTITFPTTRGWITQSHSTSQNSGDPATNT